MEIGIMPPAIARVKITLDYIGPAVIRRIEVPFDIDLDRLHQTIHAAMGLRVDDLYEFCAGNVRWGIPDPDEPDFWLDARTTRLSDVVKKVGKALLRYAYELPEPLMHTIEIERLVKPKPGVVYPRLIAARGRRPPELNEDRWGSIGPNGIIDDPCHELHAELVNWIREDKRLSRANKPRLAAGVAALADVFGRAGSELISS